MTVAEGSGDLAPGQVGTATVTYEDGAPTSPAGARRRARALGRGRRLHRLITVRPGPASTCRPGSASYADRVLELRPARPDDPDALLLTDEVQRYYVELYGGQDHDPLDVEEFVPPRGRFLLGYADGEPIAMGGWSFLHGAEQDAKIRRMYVRPAGRRLGFAAAVLDALEDGRPRDAGAARTVLATGRRRRTRSRSTAPAATRTSRPSASTPPSRAACSSGRRWSPRTSASPARRGEDGEAPALRVEGVGDAAERRVHRAVEDRAAELADPRRSLVGVRDLEVHLPGGRLPGLR